MKLKIISAMALVLLLLTVAPGVAGAAGIELTYDLNFSSNEIHQNTWSRLEVSVTNKGAGDVEGILTVTCEGQGQYRQEVFVQAGKSTSAIFYLPPTMDRHTSSGNATITLNDARGRELQRTRFTYKPPNVDTDYGYVGVLGGNVKGVNEFASTLPNARVVNVGPEHLIHLPFAENFSIMVINDPQSVMMNPQHQENLRLWVEQGGVLILGGGSGWQRTLDLVPAELVPIQPQGVGTVAAADLAALKLPVPIPQQNYSIALGESKGKVLQAAGDIPLLVQKELGRGAVLWSALDLAAPPLDSTGNNIAFWQQLLMFQPIQAQGTQLRSPWIIDNIFNSISQGEMASSLSPLNIFLLLLAYILLAGPINWLVLRRLDRREWAWVTIPLLAILFTTGTFVVGRGSRSAQQLLYQLNLIQVQSENLARVDGHGGVFVPNRSRVTITSSAALAPKAGGAMTPAANGGSITFDNPPLWSVQRFVVSDYLPLPGNFSIVAKLQGFNADTLEVQIVNNSGHALFDSYIRIGTNWFHVGPLDKEAVASVSSSAQEYFSFGDILQRYSIYAYHGGQEISELLPSAPMLFIGFGEEGVLSVNGAGETVAEGEKPRALDVWIQALDSDTIAFNQGLIDIPRGFLTPQILVGSSGYVDRRSNHYEFSGQGSIDLAFTLPTGLDSNQGQYYLNLEKFWGADQDGSILVYNHSAGEWQEISSLRHFFSSPRAILLENPGALILNQRLLVRVEHDGPLGFESDGINITVEGGRIND